MSASSRLGRGCDQCPMEAVISFYFQCKNPNCRNYTAPLVNGEVPRTGDSRPQQRPIDLYGRWSDRDLRDNKFKGKSARDLIGLTMRGKLNGNSRIPHAIRFSGVFELRRDPQIQKPDQVRVVNVLSEVVLTFLDWDGYKWNNIVRSKDILPY